MEIVESEVEGLVISDVARLRACLDGVELAALSSRKLRRSWCSIAGRFEAKFRPLSILSQYNPCDARLDSRFNILEGIKSFLINKF